MSTSSSSSDELSSDEDVEYTFAFRFFPGGNAGNSRPGRVFFAGTSVCSVRCGSKHALVELIEGHGARFEYFVEFCFVFRRESNDQNCEH